MAAPKEMSITRLTPIEAPSTSLLCEFEFGSGWFNGTWVDVEVEVNEREGFAVEDDLEILIGGLGVGLTSEVAEIGVPITTLLLVGIVDATSMVEDTEELVCEFGTIVMFCEEARWLKALPSSSHIVR